jgi:hypothetical protein
VAVSGNRPPEFSPLPAVFGSVLTPLILTNIAADPDLTNTITYSMLPGAPTNAHLNSAKGIFYWTPARQQSPSTNTITLRAMDDGTPRLSNTVSFVIYVNDYLEMTVGSTVLLAGDSTNVPIDLFSSTPISDFQCAIQFPTDRLTNATIDALLPADTASLSVQPSDPGTALLVFTAMPGHTFQGTQHVGRLNFTTVSNQTSAFVPLLIGSLAGTRSEAGFAPTPLANGGRAVIIGEQPLLDKLLLVTNKYRVTLYGNRNTTYQMQYATSLDAAALWNFRLNVPLTTTVSNVSLGTLGAPPLFFRAVLP